jgi:hypothetical protein
LNNNNPLDLIFSTDEAWFHLSGYINKQNMRIWSAESAETSHDFVQSPFHPEKIVVWLAISRVRIFGPFFFKGLSMPRDIEIIYLNFFTKIFVMTESWNFPSKSGSDYSRFFFIFPYFKNTMFKNNPHNVEELQKCNC